MRKRSLFIRIVLDAAFRYQCYGRLSQSCAHGFKPVLMLLMRHLGGKLGIEISNWNNIAGGLKLGHPSSITVNPSAVIGSNCLLFKGSTIGSVRSGGRAGAPVLGNNVVVGCNAMVCGGIEIGNDVLIVANAFVDFNVPSNSLVIGNPGVIKSKQSPCKDYL